MSALDQAFIKAYAKDAPAPAAPGAGRDAYAPSSPASPLAHLDDLYADGALYRLESQPYADVPPPHYAPPPSQHRTIQRRVIGRHRPAAEPQIDTGHSGVESPPPVRRTPTRGLHEIARQLAYYLPPGPANEPPSEMLVVEEPDAKQLAPAAAPQSPAAQQSVAPAAAGAPPATKTRDVAKPPAVEAPALPVVERGMPADDVATLVEVCTPWEPINDFVSGSMVILTDPPILSAAPAQALVDVTLDPIIQRRGVDRQPAFGDLQDAAVLPTLTNASGGSTPAKSAPPKKTHRIDSPEPQAIQPPHFAKSRNAGSTQPPLKASGSAASELPSASPLAPLTPEETASLIGTASSPPAAAEPQEPPAPAIDSITAEPLVPMWEVDRFQWPSICDRLMKDEQSYFAQAGGKLVAAAKDGLKTLGITGSRRGEGRTTLALCLARCAAQSGLNVAMIDADFTRPQLAAVIGLEVAYGWQDAAQGKIPVPEAAVRSLADKITVLPLEASSVAWPLALSDKRVAAMIRAVAQTHDLVIVDLGPLSGGSESVFAVDEVAPLDAVIVLRDLRYATPSETQAIGQRLHESGVEAIGIAENFVPAEKARS